MRLNINPLEREGLGMLVRAAWVEAVKKEFPNATNWVKDSWAQLDPRWKEVDRAVGEALFQNIGPAFNTFSTVNRDRCEQSFFSLSKWDPLQWMGAAAGELGEAANLAKKIWRVDQRLNNTSPKDSLHLSDCMKERRRLVKELGQEIADCVTYLDLACHREGLVLADELYQKFDVVSARPSVNFPRRLLL